MNQFFNQIRDWIQKFSENIDIVEIVKVAIILAVIAGLAWLADYITRKILIRLIYRLVRKTKSQWDDLLIDRKVLARISHLTPALVVYYLIELAFKDSTVFVNLAQSGIYIYLILIGLLIIDSVIDVSHDIYQTLPIAKERTIKGYIQVVKIIIYFIVIILILSIILGKSPTKLLTGLGAVTAVLLLVFKDTILGLVASIQISANNMLKVGDWIEMPKYNADGPVIEITLNTVKVQNWDKTITTVPTYSLISDSFYNWRGMEESGGRRIKRSIFIDMESIKFCTDELIQKLSKIQILKPYIDSKLKELEEYNIKSNADLSSVANGRRITNLGTFRKYLEAYLRNHPMIHNNMTFLVRHLQPSDKGLPLEIYVFSKDKVWANYESIQADIFDHIIAVIPEFELRIFQFPSGSNLRHYIS
ncbi:mechanosensitive ion channel family protein [Bacteroidota bacterium]